MPKITLNISDAAMPQAEARAKALGHGSVEDWVKAIVTADFEEAQRDHVHDLLQRGLDSASVSHEDAMQRLRDQLPWLEVPIET